MMKLELLVQGLHWIETLHKLAETLLLHKQVSNKIIEIYIMNFIRFSKNYPLLSLLLIFIERQSHHSSENNPERNCNS